MTLKSSAILQSSFILYPKDTAMNTITPVFLCGFRIRIERLYVGVLAITAHRTFLILKEGKQISDIWMVRETLMGKQQSLDLR